MGRVRAAAQRESSRRVTPKTFVAVDNLHAYGGGHGPSNDWSWRRCAITRADQSCPLDSRENFQTARWGDGCQPSPPLMRASARRADVI